ncbi:hypothetical protein [Nocardia concava]|uniref:hypothetical protein n=1 Tax=Nocardia concava TaxID=257281 RepID=UPI0002F2AC82|nr:hypothetical protein [Nocardia concava]
MTVTVDDSEWLALNDAAECAGMSVESYIGWGVRLLAMQAVPGGSKRRVSVSPRKAQRRIDEHPDMTQSEEWVETFAERLSHRAEQFRLPPHVVG